MQTVYRVADVQVYREDAVVWVEQSNDGDNPSFICFDLEEADEICAAIMKAKAGTQ